MADRPRVGFIGVGLMGWGMAKNAVEKGFPLAVLAHRKREAVDDLVRRGATEAPDAAALAAASDVVALCVTGSPQVEANIAAMKPALRPGMVVVDCSTSEPTSTARLAAELAGIGVTLLDAPLSRTPAHAWDGELTTYIGGDPATIERLRPLFATWATVIIPTGGPAGSAHTVKLVNNLIAIGFAALWSEAYATAEAAGVAPAVLHRVVSNSGMNCGNFQNYSKYVLEGDASAHKFTLENCVKDIAYYSRLAERVSAPTLVSSGVAQMLRIGANLGMGPRYMPEMVEVFRALGKRPD